VVSPTVVIVGPPGAGKSSVGSLLAQRLGVAFANVDDEIEAAAGMPISEIFTTRGEPAFRELEERAVGEALAGRDGVLALGGGAVLSGATRAALRGYRVLFLSVGMPEGVRRTGLSTARPLLTGLNPRATFKALLDARAARYEEVATVTVHTDGCTQDEVAGLAVAALGARGELPEGTG
jgi:shikimate kinase